MADFKRCFRKALEYQIRFNAYSYIEILGVCVTGSKIKPTAIREQVETNMIPVFPLGVFKDIYK